MLYNSRRYYDDHDDHDDHDKHINHAIVFPKDKTLCVEENCNVTKSNILYSAVHFNKI